MAVKHVSGLVVRRMAVVAVCLLSMCHSGLAAQTVTVHLLSGRSFSGQLQPSANDHYLSLRSSAAGMDMVRQIAWSRVVSLELNGEELSPNAFQSQVGRAVPASVRGKALHSVLRMPPSGTQPPSDIHLVGNAFDDASADRGYYPGSESQALPPARISSIHIDAYVANWDRDVEADGLIVHLYPFAEDGSLVPARGSLELQLTAEQQGFNTVHQTFTDVGHWSRRVLPDDFSGEEAVYRLEFQSRHPDFDLYLRAKGLLHARLAVPGQGVFEASCAAVRIRHYSPIRDRLEQREGVRFLSHEGLGRTQ
jgi:hypothetical protein